MSKRKKNEESSTKRFFRLHPITKSPSTNKNDIEVLRETRNKKFFPNNNENNLSPLMVRTTRSAAYHQIIKNGNFTNISRTSPSASHFVDRTPGSNQWKCSTRIEEELRPIYCVKFSSFHSSPNEYVFAAAGGRRISIYSYEFLVNRINLKQTFIADESNEDFLTIEWSRIPDRLTKSEIVVLIVGGFLGTIRVIDVNNGECVRSLIGHGSSVNYIRLHPLNSSLLFSASKDHNCRLWNVESNVTIAQFGGVDGHRDEVLSLDVHRQGDYLVTGGMDHSIRLWYLERTDLLDAVKLSFQYDRHRNRRKFPMVNIHFPIYCTRDIHHNYIDCVQWFGDLILSKSCEEQIILWKIGRFDEDLRDVIRPAKFNAAIFVKLPIKDLSIWFIRFQMNDKCKRLVCGTKSGRILVYQLGVSDAFSIRCHVLFDLNNSDSPIRSTTISDDANVVIGTNDVGNIFVWTNKIN